MELIFQRKLIKVRNGKIIYITPIVPKDAKVAIIKATRITPKKYILEVEFHFQFPLWDS